MPTQGIRGPLLLFANILDTLKGFFTSHSGRMGYGSRVAAKILSQGGNVQEIYGRLGLTGLWSPNSSAIERYCDTRVRRFFDGDIRLLWVEFKRLSPETMHGLSHINEPRKRPYV